MRPSIRILIVLLVLAIPMAALAAPRVEVCDRTINLSGPIAAGQTAHGTFIIRNHGDSDLYIQNVIVSCGCATPTYDQTISPGGEGRIILSVDTTGYSGQIRKTAIVRTNDPVTHQFTITLSMQVNP